MLEDQQWIVLGDFNLIRRPENRNKPCGDVQMMFLFNEAISRLGLIEHTLKGQAFTWCNKQQNILLERLDWFFVSNAWSIEWPSTYAKTLTRDTSDHVPCVILVQTGIPKPKLFRFEIFWFEHRDFQGIFKQAWDQPFAHIDPDKRLTPKFKHTLASPKRMG
jgi:hypothetical protein